MPRGTFERGNFALARDLAVGLAVAGVVFALSYENGGFGVTTRAYAGIAAWWLLGIGAAIGIGAVRTRLDRFGIWALGLLAAFTVWSVISVAWAPDAERTFDKFDQVLLYLAVLALAIVLGRTISSHVLVGGVALGVAGIAGVSFVSRVFPSSFGVQSLSCLPEIYSRLCFPLGYWNGLGIEVALLYPLLLALMTSRRSPVVSALAALPLPVVAADMYLTSSRGAFVAAGVGLVVYLAITPRRWAALTAIVLAAAESAVAVATLQPRQELVTGDMTNPLAIHQGHHVALVLGIAAVLGALVWFGLTWLAPRAWAPPRIAGQGLVAAVAVLVVVGIVLSHPVARFDAFTSSTFTACANTDQTCIEQHLLSTSGSGRWQFWGAAIHQFAKHPLQGGGGGSWFYWWLQHQTSIYSQFAHSLYLESLGELGIVGFLLIVGAALVALVGAVRSALTLASAEVAAAAACAIAFFVAASYDWIWELAGITVVGMGMVGVALGASPVGQLKPWRRENVVRPAVALVAVGAVIAQFIALSANLHLNSSYTAFDTKSAARATSEALAAKALEPWAASPYVELAQLAEGEGHYKVAHRWLEDAIQRSPLDSDLWAAIAQLDVIRDRIGAAKKEYNRAHTLWPTNPNLLPTASG